jgi:transcriptional regulator with XRE-family HTH domain
MKLSERVKELRNNRGYTQASLAGKLGVTRSAVNAWEMGNAIPSTIIIVKLAREFQVSADYLLGIDDEKMLSVSGLTTRETDSVSNIIDCFRECRKSK